MNTKNKKRINISYENKVQDETNNKNTEIVNKNEDEDVFSNIDIYLKKSIKILTHTFKENNYNNINLIGNFFDDYDNSFISSEKLNTNNQLEISENKEDEVKLFSDKFMVQWEQIVEMRKSIRIPFDDIKEELDKTKEISRAQYKFQLIIWLIFSIRSQDSNVKKTFFNFINYGFNCETLINIGEVKMMELLGGVSFKHNKSKVIIQTIKIIKNVYNGDPPETREEVITLPGIGPSMTEVYLNYVTNNYQNIMINGDLHRVFNRLKWVSSENHNQTKELSEKFIPKNLYSKIFIIVDGFGKGICSKIEPQCHRCLLKDTCHFNLNNGIQQEKMKRKKNKEKIDTTINNRNVKKAKNIIENIKSKSNQNILENINKNNNNKNPHINNPYKSEEIKIELKLNHSSLIIKSDKQIMITQNKIITKEKINLNYSNLKENNDNPKFSDKSELKKIKISNKENLSKIVKRAIDNVSKINNLDKEELISNEFLDTITYNIKIDTKFKFDSFLPTVNKRRPSYTSNKP